MAKLVLENLSKIYDHKVVAVKNVNLVIEDREFLVLVGPSGCGKSTILRMIAGIEEITEGNIFIGETKVNDVQPKDRDIAMVFQNYALYPHMTVYENMAFALKMKKTPKEEIQKRVLASANILGIEDLLKRKPKQLSGGQRQRVALGRAIVRKPQVFLMDEPLSNLDAKLRVQMRTEICRLYRKLNTTVVYVTHDQTEAMTMGSQIVVLKDGEIQQADTPQNIYKYPANTFVASFIGIPPMNLIEALISEKGNKILLSFAQGSFIVPSAKAEQLKAQGYIGKKVVFGIRAEDIVLFESPIEMEPVIGEVEVIENLGAELNIHFTTASGEMITKVHPGVKIEPEQKIKLFFDLNNIHLFDKQTGKRIV
ncbi:MAG: sn-glycerol-3-phosphate ABC transporter ATP-binding protein UgpC [Clostridia bacterium]|nr:sn-glycerol-3-phosphate ABC transporter ATP-binding protein UgpC [Clostridia bacterium]